MYFEIREDNFVKYYYCISKCCYCLRLAISNHILFKNLITFYLSINRLQNLAIENLTTRILE